MSNPFSTLQRRLFVWLLMVAIITITQPSCNTEKRVTKKLLKLEKGDLNKVRPWPHNYTYHEYVQKLDNAKIRQEFYRKRALQARIAEDKVTEKVMNDNVDEYEKTITNLERDKQFYKIYKLREQEIHVKIKQEQKVQKDIAKQKDRIDKEALQREKDDNKKREEFIKNRLQRLDEKKKRLEDERKEYVNTNKDTNKSLEKKRKELRQLQKVANESGDANDPNFVEGIAALTAEVDQLETIKQTTEIKIEDLTSEIEDFIEENYTAKDTVIESQMILSTDPIPQRTDEKIKALPEEVD